MATSSFSLNRIFNVSPQHLGVRRTSKIPAKLVETIVCHEQLFSARLAVSLTGPSPSSCFSSTVPSLSCLFLHSIRNGLCCGSSPVPLLCSIPHCCSDPFHPFFVSWQFVVACCAGWTSSTRTNNSHAFHIPRYPSAQWAADTASTVPLKDPLSSSLFYRSTWLLCRSPKNNYKVCSIADRSHIPSCKRPTPSEAQHACSRLLPTSPWLIDRRTGHLHTHPPCIL